MSTRAAALGAAGAAALGAAGAVVGGFYLGAREIRALGFPAFSTGSYAQDQRLRGRVIDFGCPIEFPGAVRVEPGDVVVGDVDGVVIVPRVHAGAITADAVAKIAAEARVRDRIGGGQSTQSIFDETGVM